MDMIPIRVSFLEYNAVIWRNIQNAFISTEYIIAEKGIHIKNIRSFLNSIPLTRSRLQFIPPPEEEGEFLLWYVKNQDLKEFISMVVFLYTNNESYIKKQCQPVLSSLILLFTIGTPFPQQIFIDICLPDIYFRCIFL